MKILVAALVAVILWNGCLTGLVLWQKQALEIDEAYLATVGRNQTADYTEIKKIVKVQNQTTRKINDQQEFNDDTVKVIKEIVKVLSEPDAPVAPTKMDQSQFPHTELEQNNQVYRGGDGSITCFGEWINGACVEHYADWLVK